MSDKKNLFDELGLDVTSSEASQLEVGESYPIYGCITNIIREDLEKGEVQVEINYSIELTLSLSDPDKLEIIKERAFEPGIFVTKITEKLNSDGLTSTRHNEETGETEIVETTDGVPITGVCSTVVYGRKQHSGMM